MMLSDVCLSHTSGLSREQRGLGRPKLTQRSVQPTSHVTRTPLSRSKGQGHEAALLTAVLVRQTAAAVGVGTCWDPAATLPSARRRFGVQVEERGGAYRGDRPPAYSLLGLLLEHVNICLFCGTTRLYVVADVVSMATVHKRGCGSGYIGR